MDDTNGPDLFQGRYWNDAGSIAAGADAHRLGSGGLFVQTDAAPAVGSTLQFELTIGSEPPVSGVVRVLEARAPAGATRDLPAGMRVKFVHLDDPIHARDVLARVVVQPTATMAPPPSPADAPPSNGDAPPSSRAAPPSSRDVLWDRAVALEEEFFERTTGPVSISEDDGSDVAATRVADPKYVARQQQLRRAFGAVVLGAAILFGATAVRTGAATDETAASPSMATTPAAASPPPSSPPAPPLTATAAAVTTAALPEPAPPTAVATTAAAEPAAAAPPPVASPAEPPLQGARTAKAPPPRAPAPRAAVAPPRTSPPPRPAAAEAPSIYE